MGSCYEEEGNLVEAAKSFCVKNNLILNVDNCFATPYLQQPAQWGADLITHSATKYIDGQGRVVGGIVAGRKELITEIKKLCRSTGPSLSPFNAWVLSKSLETLAVRMDRHCDNAEKLAPFLAQHPQCHNVRYPFLDSHTRPPSPRPEHRHHFSPPPAGRQRVRVKTSIHPRHRCLRADIGGTASTEREGLRCHPADRGRT